MPRELVNLATWRQKRDKATRGLPTVDGWELPLATGVILVLLAAGLTAASPSSEPSTVAAPPAEGDAGRFEVRSTVSDGTTTVERTQQTWVRHWSTEDHLLPSGETRQLATITYELVDEADEATVDRATLAAGALGPLSTSTGLQAGTGPEVELPRLSFGYTSLPGSAAVEALELVVDDSQNDDRHVIEETETRLEPCQGARIAQLLDRSPQAAREALEDCVPEWVHGHLDQTDVSTEWETHPTYGATWLVQANATFAHHGQPAHLDATIRTSPAVPFPVEENLTTTTGTGEDLVRRTWSAHLTAFDGGSDPLPNSLPALEPGEPIDLVEWTQQGAQEGGIEALDFGQALVAAREDDEVERFQEEHPDANLYSARYVQRHASEETRTPSARTDARGCSYRNPGPTTQAPSTDESTPTWKFAWSGEGEHLEALVSDHGPQATDPIQDADFVTTETSSWASTRSLADLGLPTLAPSPQALFDRIDVVDRFADGGDPYVEVQTPWVAHRPVPVLEGEVGRTHCKVDPATGTYTSWTEGLEFEDGRPTRIFDLAFQAQGDESAPASFAGDPPRVSPSAPTDSIPTGPIGLAGVAMVATGAALGVASRGLGPLYSRFTSDDVLDSSKRQRLYDTIQDGLGLTQPELAEETGMHPSSVDHHVTMLERHGLVEVTRTPAGAIAQATGHPATRHAEALARKGSREALYVLAEEGPLDTVSALGDALGVSTSQASRVASRLEEAGLLAREQDGRSNRLRLSDRGRDLMEA